MQTTRMDNERIPPMMEKAMMRGCLVLDEELEGLGFGAEDVGNMDGVEESGVSVSVCGCDVACKTRLDVDIGTVIGVLVGSN